MMLAVASMVACSSAQPRPCGEPLRVRAPRNFGEVITTDGRQTAIYRGGQPKDCGELEYLRSLGVRSILKLNDRGLGGCAVEKLPSGESPEGALGNQRCRPCRLAIDIAEKEQAGELGMMMNSFAFSAATIGRPASCVSVREALTYSLPQLHDKTAARYFINLLLPPAPP